MQDFQCAYEAGEVDIDVWVDACSDWRGGRQIREKKEWLGHGVPVLLVRDAGWRELAGFVQILAAMDKASVARSYETEWETTLKMNAEFMFLHGCSTESAKDVLNGLSYAVSSRMKHVRREIDPEDVGRPIIAVEMRMWGKALGRTRKLVRYVK